MLRKSKTILSPLRLLDYQVLKSSYNFIRPIEDSVNLNPQDLFDDYEIDIDYAIEERNDTVLLFFMKCGVNFRQEEPKIGYELFAEIVNVFDCKNIFKELGDNQARQTIIYSGISISVNNLRNYFSDITKRAPFKDYLMPALDIQSLIRVKSEKLETQTKKAKKTKGIISTAPNK